MDGDRLVAGANLHVAGAAAAFCGAATLPEARGRGAQSVFMQLRQGAGVTIVATWVVALAITWVSPFLAPVGLLALLLPLVIVADHLGPRTRTATIVATVVLCGLLSGIGVARWPALRSHPPGHHRAPCSIVAIFVPVLVSVLVAGLRDYVTRLGERTRELEESRARLAVAAIEARRSIERDLHDGAQQRLATIAVDLGRATRMFDQDPPQARRIVQGLQGAARGGDPRAARPRARHLPAAARRARAGRRPARGGPPHDPAVHRRRALAGPALALGRGGGLLLLHRGHPERRPALGRLDHHRAGVRRRGPGRGLRFSVTDDGLGFDPAAVRSAHGLTGMRDRIRAAGGELRIISAPGRGTTVEGHFPPGTRQPR